MNKRTDGNENTQNSADSKLEKVFVWRLTEKDKLFLRAMNISPE